MDSPTELLKKNLSLSIRAKQCLLASDEQMATFEKLTNLVISCYQRGGRLYIAGNGGSAADAQHLAAEFVSRLARDRDPLPAEALTVDSSILTAIGNDYGYDQVFARQIAGKMTPKDIFLAFTTSGNSQNILTALDMCRRMGITTIVFSGVSGGKSKNLANYCMNISADKVSTIQETHIILAHTLCECVEQRLFGN